MLYFSIWPYTAVTIAINNSDIDFTFFNGRLIINYSWGNQQGTEFLGEAEYYGTEASFFIRIVPLRMLCPLMVDELEASTHGGN